MAIMTLEELSPASTRRARSKRRRLSRLYRAVYYWATERHRMSFTARFLIVCAYTAIAAYPHAQHWHYSWELPALAAFCGLTWLFTPPASRAIMESLTLDGAGQRSIIWNVLRHNLCVLFTAKRPRLSRFLALAVPSYLAFRLYDLPHHLANSLPNWTQHLPFG